MTVAVRNVLVITRGLPASGKTTLAREWVAARPEERVRLNRDDLRFNMYGAYWGLSRQQEDTITVAQHNAVRALLEAGRSVVVDDMHLRLAYVKAWEQIAARAGAEFAVQDVPTGPTVCIERDSERGLRHERQVGRDVIDEIAKRFHITDTRWMPPFERNEEVPYTYVPPPPRTKPDAWLIDMDGTLAHSVDRGPFEWHRVGEDLLDASLARLAGVLYPQDDIIVLSGRDEVCRPETTEWLRRHEIQFDALLMRPEGDSRKDAVVKLELFREHVAPHYHVHAVFDDRDQVVDMWRSIGLPCYQVAPGRF